MNPDSNRNSNSDGNEPPDATFGCGSLQFVRREGPADPLPPPDVQRRNEEFLRGLATTIKAAGITLPSSGATLASFRHTEHQAAMRIRRAMPHLDLDVRADLEAALRGDSAQAVEQRFGEALQAAELRQAEQRVRATSLAELQRAAEEEQASSSRPEPPAQRRTAASPGPAAPASEARPVNPENELRRALRAAPRGSSIDELSALAERRGGELGLAPERTEAIALEIIRKAVQ